MVFKNAKAEGLSKFVTNRRAVPQSSSPLGMGYRLIYLSPYLRMLRNNNTELMRKFRFRKF